MGFFQFYGERFLFFVVRVVSIHALRDQDSRELVVPRGQFVFRVRVVVASFFSSHAISYGYVVGYHVWVVVFPVGPRSVPYVAMFSSLVQVVPTGDSRAPSSGLVTRRFRHFYGPLAGSSTLSRQTSSLVEVEFLRFIVFCVPTGRVVGMFFFL